MKKKLGLMKLFTIALISPPFTISALFGLYYAVCGIDCFWSRYDGIDGFLIGGVTWFIIIYACKLGLLAAAWILFGFVKLFKHLANTLKNTLTVTAPR